MSGAVEWSWPTSGDASAEVLAAISEPAKWVVETSGWNFEKALARWVPKEEVAQPEEEEESPTSNSPTTSPGGSKKPKKEAKVKATKLSEAELEGEHYEILGLCDKEWEATYEEVAKAYKKKCLEYHPDKNGGKDTMFKKCQVAGDVLMDPNKRKAYDSSLPFDDSIPPPKVPEERFYMSYAPVFLRNRKWYLYGQEKVPELGDASTPIKEVEAFYTFWLGFKSWRDFQAVAAEHDLEQAEDRYERRWMERENTRAMEKAKKEEMSRIITLVERAYKADPRIKKRDFDEKEAKLASYRAREAEEEAKKAAAEAAKKKAEEDSAAAKVNKKQLQADTKKAKQAVRKVYRDWDGTDNLDMADIDWLLTKLELPALQKLGTDAAAAAANKEECLHIVFDLIDETELVVCETRKGKSTKPKEEVAEVVKEEESVWTDADLVELQKACVKFPAGTMTRWEKLSEFLMDRKTPMQCLKKVKQLEREYRMPQQGGSSLKAASSKTELPSAQKKDDSLNSKENKRQFKTTPEGAAIEGGATPPAASLEEDIWSPAQQKQLETVLREMKAYKDKDKWDKIAEKVEGKSKKQCVDRYKFLCTSLKK